MKTPINPWAYAPSTQRREPTSTEIANGFPCGPADQLLFNELMYRNSIMAKEIGTVISGEGIAFDETKFDQLQQAISNIILRYNGNINLFVNVAGSDTADGLSSGTALKTLNEAFNRARGYLSASITLDSDITVSAALPVVYGTAMYFYSPSVARTITLAPGSWTVDPADGLRRVIRYFGTLNMAFRRINIVNNVIEPTVDGVIQSPGGYFSFDTGVYSVVSASARPLLQPNNATGVALGTGIFANSNAAGLFLKGIASGGSPNVWPYACNLATLSP